MAASWKSLSANPAFRVERNGLTVQLGGARRHRVTVEDGQDAFVLRSVVLNRSRFAQVRVPSTRIWEMNRALTLVGFRIDAEERLIGEARIPKVGITAQEFQAVATNLAAECDRYERIFTNLDQE
ncbi:hypothetical protein BWI17_19260 [Betaproteobacteria bacterium GR16-43]|nr:hypothetical protein BWI17_19260 [Betaproteobacteria bacterium GR16-43]